MEFEGVKKNVGVSTDIKNNINTIKKGHQIAWKWPGNDPEWPSKKLPNYPKKRPNNDTSPLIEQHFLRHVICFDPSLKKYVKQISQQAVPFTKMTGIFFHDTCAHFLRPAAWDITFFDPPSAQKKEMHTIYLRSGAFKDLTECTNGIIMPSFCMHNSIMVASKEQPPYFLPLGPSATKTNSIKTKNTRKHMKKA